MSSSILGQIPSEILGQVFFHTSCEDYVDFRSYSSQVPVVVSQVCKQWRQAALGHSELWSRVNLDIALPWGGRRLSDVLWMHLLRSGACALDVRINDTGFMEWQRDGDSDLDDSLPVELDLPIALLKKHAERISRLTIDLLPCVSAWTTLEKSNIRFPSLVSLHITHSGPDPEEHLPLSIFSASSSLVEIELNYHLNEKMLLLPLNMISHLTVTDTDIRFQSDILKRATSLQKIHWEYDFQPFRRNFPKNLLILHSIQEFSTNNVPSHKLRSVLRTLQFPGLRKVSGFDIGAFVTSRSFLATNSLTTLSLWFQPEAAFSTRVEELLVVLPQVAPMLHHFSLSVNPQTSRTEFLCALEDIDRGFATLTQSISEEGQQYFTNLETLHLGDMPLSAVDQPLLRMVCKGSLKKLKELKLVFPCSWTLQPMFDFRHQMNLACRKAGVWVTIEPRSGIYAEDVA